MVLVLSRAGSAPAGERAIGGRHGIALALGLLAIAACDESADECVDAALVPSSDAAGAASLDDAGMDPVADVTHESLLMELLDPGDVARAPDLPFRTRMASSYDRASTAPDEPGWFGNADAGQFIRSERIDDRTEYVMLEADGPGAVTRLWTAIPVGTLRVYLDGAPRPTIELPFEDLFAPDDPLERELSYRVPHGDAASCGAHVPLGAGNSYLPIPYARSIKITVDDPETYYQVSYRTYATDVRVESLDESDLASTACILEDAASRDGAVTDTHERVLAVWAGETTELTIPAETDGAAIHRLAVDLGTTDPDVLRSVWVSIAFDGHETIRGPLTEVLGQGGPGLRDSESAASEVRGTHMQSLLVMPFRREAVIGFQSGGSEPLTATVDYDVGAYRFGPEDWLLHAHWMPPYSAEVGQVSERRHLTIEGRGRYVGNVMNVMNSSRAWWGEGDEKIWVDDESFPSFFGTGTEDYFGYAYCSAAEFSRPFHGQTRVEGPETYGRLSLYRWHLQDSISFEASLSFDLETRHWRDYAIVAYEALHFWYGPPDATAGSPSPVDFEVPDVPAHDPELAGDGDIPNDWTP